MNRNLSYGGKNVHEMTAEELKRQLEINKKRMTGNKLVMVVITGATLIACAPVAVLVIAIGVLRRNWLLENNAVLQEELNKR
ncbi:MAG: hypothetical protein HFJ44_07410 [Clostridia bacterium]|jgi:uncharacterized membrane protein|nr:hypothetical protein [Clostridia bacterium]